MFAEEVRSCIDVASFRLAILMICSQVMLCWREEIFFCFYDGGWLDWMEEFSLRRSLSLGGGRDFW